MRGKIDAESEAARLVNKGRYDVLEIYPTLNQCPPERIGYKAIPKRWGRMGEQVKHKLVFVGIPPDDSSVAMWKQALNKGAVVEFRDLGSEVMSASG